MTKFKFEIEIATDIVMEELNIDYRVVQENIKYDVEEAIRNYGLDVLGVECIEE
jgi:hypothetical protein